MSPTPTNHQPTNEQLQQELGVLKAKVETVRVQIESFERVANDVHDIKVAILGDLRHPNEPGLIDQIRGNTRHREKQARITWTAIGAAIAAILAAVVNWFISLAGRGG